MSHIKQVEKELMHFKASDVFYLSVSLIDAARPYGYEFLGNT